MSRQRLMKTGHQDALEAMAVQPGLATAVARGTDLGGGYYLLQLRDAYSPVEGEDGSTVNTLVQQLQQVPKISDPEIIDLVARINQRPSIDVVSSPNTGTKARASQPHATGRNEEFLAQFEKKELQRRSQLEKKGVLIDSQALADRMGVTRQAINKAEAELRMFSLDGVSGTKLYPAFFADAQIDRRNIQKISKALDRLAGASKWQFFTNPRLSLGKKTPVEALRKGKFDQVMAAAVAFREA